MQHAPLDTSQSAATLWDALQIAAKHDAGSLTRRDRHDTDVTFTASDLMAHATTIAQQLISQGAQAGDCVMLVTGDPLAFACGFWACQAAGLAAVPMPPMGSDAQQERTLAAMAVLDRTWVLTEDRDTQAALAKSPHALGAFVLGGADYATLDGIAPAETDADAQTPFAMVDPLSVAVVMFSSGSTGAPKGVDLTHRAILAQMDLLTLGLSLGKDDRVVNWMPMSHDFGLFHFHILPLLRGLPQLLMAPEDFSRRPISWIKALSDFRGTITGAPNLALEIVTSVMKPDRAAQFDLSPLRVITLGAEPLVPHVLHRFAHALSPAGFDAAALRPAYGLAEATLVITMHAGLDTVTVSRRALEPGQKIDILDRSNADALELPLLGKPITGAAMRIVDADGAAVTDGHVGHMHVQSDAMMTGYRNRPAQTTAVLLADGWLDTGDIGFVHHGEFVMVGRAKDVIISGGRNFHPSDLERVAQTTPQMPVVPQVAIAQGRDPETNAQNTIAFFRVRGKKLDLSALHGAITTHMLAQTGVALDRIIGLRDLPRTTSGKIQRHALVRDFEAGRFLGQDVVSQPADDGNDLRNAVACTDVQRATQLIINAAAAFTGNAVTADDPLMDQGLSSRQAIALCAQLGGWLYRDISIARLFDHPSAGALAAYLMTAAEDANDPTQQHGPSQSPIAIIGYGSRFPGSDTSAAFWDFLNAPTPVVGPVPADRWTHDAPLPPAALLSDIDRFDPALFGLSQTEAAGMNPLQRLVLDVLWQAMENAGLDLHGLAGKRVGLFIGLSDSGLATGRAETLPDPDAQAGYAVVGSAGSIAVGRIAHLFDFRGPAMAVDTACSSSLTALDLAAQSLAQGRCDLAVAGGANLILSPDLHAALADMGALSPDGLCKTFDTVADGYGRGEGAGLVILKRTADAQRDADTIAAELVATAVNHDGESQSVTAPNGRAQRDLIRRALQAGDLAADDLDWVETHGTGTALGDPVELDAIETVLRGHGGKPLPLGAVKSVIGHLEAAAGIAGVIKILLAMKHGFVPANRLCSALNDRFDWDRQTVSPLADGFEWHGSGRRYAGVASFGMSGTNAYAILADAPQTAEEPPLPVRPAILPLSVVTQTATAPLARGWAAALSTSSDPADLAAGQANRRIAGPLRHAAVLDGAGHALDTPRYTTAYAAPNHVFVFPGQGAQSAQMGADFYRNEPVFKAAFDHASQAAGPVDGRDLTDWLFGADPADDAALSQTALAQPALVAFGYALTALWAHFGIRPAATLGHSVGEIGAALAAGILTLDDAMALAVTRGRVMQDGATDGAMLALRATPDQAADIIAQHPSVCIAGYNGPMSLSLSGPQAAIADVRQAAKAADLPCTPIAVTRAFHSPAMQAPSEALSAAITLTPAQGTIPLYSTLTGARATAAELTTGAYWQQQMRDPVQLTAAVTAANAPDTLYIEMGPTATLARLGPAIAPDAAWIAGAETQATFAQSVGTAWAHGADIDWLAWFGTRGANGADLPRHPRNDITIPRRPVGAAMRIAAATAHMPAQPPAPAPATSATTTPTDAMPEILAILSRISGVAEDMITHDAPLTSLGLDSLAMVQVQRALAKQAALDLDLRMLFEGAETPRKLADLLAASRPETPVATPAAPGGMADVFQAQIKLVEDLIAKQFAVLAGGETALPAAAITPPAPAHAHAPTTAPSPAPAQIKGLFSKSNDSNANLTAAQQAHISKLTTQWNARSAGSKAGAQQARAHVASSRTVFGYTPDTKEITYPLLTDRAEGAYVWDVDGSKYIDITMGFGTCLFGHNAPFVKDAIMDELQKGAALGPATPLAAQVAARINTLTGAERSAFFATGTEAIMCAVRIARAVTGRERIVVFRGAYHGSFDGVLATGWIDPDGTPQSAPMTDGTLQGMIDPVISLPYGDPKALDVIRRYADDIALVLVEPVQSRDPENRPFDFLRDLRALTHDHNVPLLLDEIISGFRFSPAGMQDVLGIKADFVTYGKVLGHGLPIGVLTGNPAYMDAVDGGMWQYGDDSGPGPRTAFVAGTFNGHPLSLAAANAVLRHIEQDNGAFQQRLAERTETLCQRLDTLFADNDVPVHMARYGSLFRFEFSAGTEILNTHLLNNGIFVWEQRNCFLSTAHSDADLDQIVQATANGIAAMKADHWFGDGPDTIASNVGEIALRRQAGLVRQGHWTDMVILKLTRAMAPDILHQHWQTLCARHAALRACLAPGNARLVADGAAGAFVQTDLNGQSLNAWADQDITTPFGFDRAPIRLTHLSDGPDHAIALTASHLAFDGWSLVLILDELFRLINGATLDPVVDEAAKYAAWEHNTAPHRLPVPPTALHLPVDGPNPQARKPAGARDSDQRLAPLYQKMATMTAQSGVTPLAGFLAAFAAMLAEQAGQTDITVAVPVSGQALSGCYDLVGNRSFLRPITVQLTPDMTFAELRARLHSAILAPGNAPPADALPARHAIFNLDGPIKLAGTNATLHPAPITGARADVFANLLILDDAVVLDFDWNADRFLTATAQQWKTRFIALAEQSLHGDTLLGDALATLDFTTKPAAPHPAPGPAPTRRLTTAEAALAALWHSLLGVEPTDPAAHFIDLGGDSLQAVRLCERINTTYGVVFGIDAVFDHAVLSDMAAAIENAASQTSQSPALIRPRPAHIPALPQQQQLRLLEESSDTGPAYNIAVRVDLAADITPRAVRDALGQVQARHAALRTTFTWDEDGLHQTVDPAAPVPLTVIADDAAAIDTCAQAAFAPDALAWRVGHVDTGDGTTLIIVLHHIISDAWSIELFIRDLMDACQRVTLGAAPLDVLARDFPDHALWHAATRADRAETIRHWQHLLHDAPKLTALTGDHPRPAVKCFDGARMTRRLPDALFAQLQTTAKQLRATPFQIILAAMTAETAQQTGQDDIILGTVSAGRNDAGMGDAIGFFANTLPLRMQVDAGQNWRDLITSCTATLHTATAHDTIGLQDMCAACGYSADPSANPYFELCLTHDDRRGLTQLGAELGFTFAEMTQPSSQFDISAYVVETGADLTLDVTYATAIHGAARIAALLDRLITHITAICDNPDQCPTTAQGPNELQKRLWFVDQFENGVLYPAAPTYYNMAAEYQCDVPADVITDRINQLMASTPMLQRGFTANGDAPAFADTTCADQRCSLVSAAKRHAFINAPFDLTHPPLIRVALTDTDNLLVVAHHIVTDIGGIDQIADALLTGVMPPVAPSRTDAVVPGDLRYWHDTIGAHPPRLLLPADRPRAAMHVYRQITTDTHLDADDTARLMRFASDRNLTTDDMITGAFAAFLHRLSGQDAVVFGKTHARGGHAIAPQANLITLHIPVSATLGTADMLVDIAAQSAQAARHGTTDFDVVVRDLKPENDMSRTALFDVLLVTDTQPVAARKTPAAIGWGKYDLVMAPLACADGGIALRLTANGEMFDHATLDAWAGILRHILRTMPDHAQTPFDCLPLMPPCDVADAMAAATPVMPAATDLTLLCAFADQVAARPDAPAIRQGDQQISYGALYADATVLARRLIAQGTGKGDHVAILLPRGQDYVCAMLATMLAGAVFIPLDLQAPLDRTALILDDAQARIVIAAPASAASLPDGTQIMDPMSDDDPDHDTPLPDIAPTDAAYVIFTSGSTGQPKGVVVEHRNVTALILGQGDLFPITSGDVWSWFHSPAFDFSVWEVWGALLTGGTLAPVPEQVQRDLSAVRGFLADEHVTQLSLTPSAFRALSDVEMTQSADLTVNAIWFGGEALVPNTLLPWARRYPDCHLLNLFGITETTVHTTFCALTGDDLHRNDSPIGTPLPSYALSLRDPQMHPVPVGVPGEIIVSGTGVARGYLHRPDQTAARFIDDPHAAGTRLYRSGDLGRQHGDGTFTYLGRADNQVKLRGYRIELGEVETAFEQVDGITAAAAGLMGDGGSERILAVWLVTHTPPDPDGLAAHLAAVLPAYMLPKQIYLIDAVPLTLNGKTDRKALTRLTDQPLTATNGAAPRAGIETDIAAVLCGVLGTPSICRDDSFFALGGHSLMANKAVLRLRKELGLDLSLRDFFTAQSVAGLATRCARPMDAPHIEPITRQPAQDKYPLSSAQTRLFAIQNADPATTAYNVTGGLLIEGAVDHDALAAALCALLGRHEILRTRFVVVAATPFQVIDPAPLGFDLPVLDLTADTQDGKIAQALDSEIDHVFDLARGPVFRAALGQLGPDRWILVINQHHIVSDGWSVPILLGDLSAFYAAKLAGAQADRPPLAIQYCDFASWQAQTGSRDAAVALTRDHLIERLHDVDPISAFETDLPRPAKRQGHGAMARHRLGAQTSAALRAHLNTSGATLFSACSAALHILLRLRGMGDDAAATVIGTADAGRDALETEDQIGFYLNMLPHAMRLQGDAPLTDWLSEAIIETSAMLGHKTAPFEQVIDALSLDPGAGHTPLFDVLLLVQTNEAPLQMLGPHPAVLIADETRTSRYDLNIMIADNADIDVQVEYDTALFTAQTVDALMADYIALLAAMATRPDDTPLMILTDHRDQAAAAQGILDDDDPLLGAL